MDSANERHFKGPNPMLYSTPLVLQDGDSILPLSANENEAKEPDVVSVVEKGKKYQSRKSEYQSAYVEEHEEMQSKPQFLRLIIAKSLQNNFLNNLWNKSYLRKLEQLTPYQIGLLDDLQIESDFIENDSFLIPVITPYSMFIVMWDVFQILTYILIFFWLPFKLSFGVYYMAYLLNWNDGAQTIELIMLAILSLDVFVGCNLAFIYKGQIIHNRKRILKHYIKTYAFVDLVSLLTISMQFLLPTLSSSDNRILYLQIMLCAVFYVLRTSKINKILSLIQEFFNLNGSLNDVLGLFKLLITAVFIAHLCGCIWHGVAYYNQDQATWLTYYGFRNSDNYTRYLNSIYWSTMTMTTVGYGDITPKNNTELLVATLTMFVATGVFAYSVNSIGLFVSNMYKSQIEYSRIVQLINNFMQKNSIQFELQTRIRSYIEYIWQEEKQQNEDEVQTIVTKLSGQLQEELEFQLRGNILRACPIIKNNFSEKVLKELLSVMEEISFSPEERIIYKDELDDFAIYIITKGEIEIVVDSLNQIGKREKRNSLQIIEQGNYFGELSFFTGEVRQETVISRGFTKVFKITREKLIKVLRGFPDDYEKFCVIKDNLIAKDYRLAQMKCYSCKSNKHLVNQCHILHYTPDADTVIKKENYPREQIRKYYERKSEKTHSLMSLQEIQDNIRDFLQNCNLAQRVGTEIDEYDTPSNLMNDAYEPESIIDIANQKSDELPMSAYFNRKTQAQKQTLQTAGFGMQASLKQSSNDDEINSDDDSEEAQDIVQLSYKPPTNIQIQNKNPQQSKTILQRKNSDDEIMQIRSNSGRGKSIVRVEKKIHANVDQQKSDLDFNSNTNNHLNGRNNTKHKSTYTHTQVDGNNLTSIQFDDRSHSRTQIGQTIQLEDMDRMYKFKAYNIINNYDIVIARYSRAQKYFGKKRLYPEFSPYSFYFLNIKKGVKLRLLGENKSKTQLGKTLQPSNTLKKQKISKAYRTIADGQFVFK